MHSFRYLGWNVYIRTTVSKIPKNPYSAHVSLEFDRTSFPQRRTETIGTRYAVIEIKCNAFITIQHNITSHIIYILYCRVAVYGV